MRWIFVCYQSEIVHAYGSEPQKNNLNISAFTSPLKLFEYMAHRKIYHCF